MSTLSAAASSAESGARCATSGEKSSARIHALPSGPTNENLSPIGLRAHAATPAIEGSVNVPPPSTSETATRAAAAPATTARPSWENATHVIGAPRFTSSRSRVPSARTSTILPEVPLAATSPPSSESASADASPSSSDSVMTRESLPPSASTSATPPCSRPTRSCEPSWDHSSTFGGDGRSTLLVEPTRRSSTRPPPSRRPASAICAPSGEYAPRRSESAPVAGAPSSCRPAGVDVATCSPRGDTATTCSPSARETTRVEAPPPIDPSRTNASIPTRDAHAAAAPSGESRHEASPAARERVTSAELSASE